jgi:hypothetical protein
MPRQRTHQEFIDKANQVHENKYDYTKSLYTKKSDKLIITCLYHGDFVQEANSHIRGHGCPKCVVKRKPYPVEQFLERANKVHNNFYSYEKFVYKNSKTKGIITCPLHGDFIQSGESHCVGSSCPDCANVRTSIANSNKTTEDFIMESKKIHGDKYDYSNTVYVRSHLKLSITCSLHGEWLQKAGDHLRGKGCRKCATEYTAETKKEISRQSFEERARKVHGYQYDYSETVYTKAKSTISIICRNHGLFEQTATTHLGGSGCPRCGRENTIKANIENPTGWSITEWQKNALKSSRFIAFRVYILLFSKDGERFYKIGRTFTTIKVRTKSIPYDVEIIHEIEHEDARIIFKLESELKRKYKDYKYLPKVAFGGMQECFSIDLPIQELISQYSSVSKVEKNVPNPELPIEVR